MQEISEFAIFSLDDQEYGIDIKNVKTIERIGRITRVPRAPEFIDGVINLRGEIIPVADTRKLLGFSSKENDGAARIIIVEVNDYLVGMKVDRVYDVQAIKLEDIDNSKQLIENLKNSFIKGVINFDGRLITILGIEKIFIAA